MKDNYKLIDSGNGKKLEKIGDYTFVRPFAQAIWFPSKDKKIWKDIHAEFQGNLEGGNGKWVVIKEIPEEFTVNYGGLSFSCRLSDYGHLGIFFEQIENWNWLFKNALPGKKYLNLFAYTGGSTLILASKGADVTHVDASKSVVKWARKNALISDLQEKNIRWITDDAYSFVEREEKRGNKYDGIILDPPTFGRGTNGEIWKIEKDLMNLLVKLKNLLTNDKNLFLLSAHSPGFSQTVLKNCLNDCFLKENIESGEMLLQEENILRNIPQGYYARFVSN